MTCYHPVKDHPGRIQICSLIHGFRRINLFRSTIKRCADGKFFCTKKLFFTPSFRKTKINNLHRSCICNHYIKGFYIPVNDIRLVQAAKPFNNLGQVMAGFVNGHLSGGPVCPIGFSDELS